MTNARTKRPAAREKKVVYISFSSEVSPQTTEALLAVCADQVNKGVSTVNLLLSTPGGSVLQGTIRYNPLLLGTAWEPPAFTAPEANRSSCPRR